MNLLAWVDDILNENHHVRDDIVCVLWGRGESIDANALSLDVVSFWEYAANTNCDRSDWVSGPHYPLVLLSGNGWWIESTEYDSRTNFRFVEEPTIKPSSICIDKNGEFYEKEKRK
ncbi:MAG: hypothetical protein J6Q22_10385 [Prevotella sp.]|nr:hypothetical protein [Prevotella sp.]